MATLLYSNLNRTLKAPIPFPIKCDDCNGGGSKDLDINTTYLGIPLVRLLGLLFIIQSDPDYDYNEGVNYALRTRAVQTFWKDSFVSEVKAVVQTSEADMPIVTEDSPIEFKVGIPPRFISSATQGIDWDLIKQHAEATNKDWLCYLSTQYGAITTHDSTPVLGAAGHSILLVIANNNAEKDYISLNGYDFQHLFKLAGITNVTNKCSVTLLGMDQLTDELVPLNSVTINISNSGNTDGNVVAQRLDNEWSIDIENFIVD